MTLGGTSTQRHVHREPDACARPRTTGPCSAGHPTRASRPTARRRSRSACRRRAPGRAARSRPSPPGEHPGGTVHAQLARPPLGPRRAARHRRARRRLRDGRDVRRTGGPSTLPAGSSPTVGASPAGDTRRRPRRPRDATYAGADRRLVRAADGAPRRGTRPASRRVGDLGSFTWDEEGSDAPWIVPRTAARSRAGHAGRRHVRPGRRAGCLDGALGADHGGRRRRRRARRPTAIGRGGVRGAPDQAGAWSLQLEARFGTGHGATWYWRRRTSSGRSRTRNRRRCRGAGRLGAGTAGSRAGPGQARAPAADALKIETCASSGSITPKIFWSARRWTHEPQLSK